MEFPRTCPSLHTTAQDNIHLPADAYDRRNWAGGFRKKGLAFPVGKPNLLVPCARFAKRGARPYTPRETKRASLPPERRPQAASRASLLDSALFHSAQA